MYYEMVRLLQLLITESAKETAMKTIDGLNFGSLPYHLQIWSYYTSSGRTAGEIQTDAVDSEIGTHSMANIHIKKWLLQTHKTQKQQIYWSKWNPSSYLEGSRKSILYSLSHDVQHIYTGRKHSSGIEKCRCNCFTQKRSKSNPENYRPIRVTSECGKIIES